MIRISAILLSMTIVLSGCSSSDGAGSAEELGEKVLSALGEGKFDSLEKLLLTEKDIDELFEYLVSSDQLTEERAEKQKAGGNRKMKEAVAAHRKAFEAVLQEADKAGIDWKKAKLESVKTEERKAAGDVQKVNLDLHVRHADAVYVLHVHEALKLKDRWKLMEDGIQFKGKF